MRKLFFAAAATSLAFAAGNCAMLKSAQKAAGMNSPAAEAFVKECSKLRYAAFDAVPAGEAFVTKHAAAKSLDDKVKKEAAKIGAGLDHLNKLKTPAELKKEGEKLLAKGKPLISDPKALSALDDIKDCLSGLTDLIGDAGKVKANVEKVAPTSKKLDDLLAKLGGAKGAEKPGDKAADKGKDKGKDDAKAKPGAAAPDKGKQKKR